jgi:hypothetical protein
MWCIPLLLGPPLGADLYHKSFVPGIELHSEEDER